MHEYGTRKRLCFNLEQYITVLQTEIYDIKACASENINKGYENRTPISYQTDRLQSKHLLTAIF